MLNHKIVAAWFCVFSLALSACSSSSAMEEEEIVSVEAEDVEQPEQPSLSTDTETKAGETLAQYDTRRDALGGSAGYSYGVGCTDDCSGHEAGRAWAEDNDISDPGDCGGNSWSFQEGCESFAEDRQAEEESE